MRPSFYIFGLALAWLITSSAQAHGRGFAWFFAHSKPQGTCSGQHVVATFYASGRRTASGQTFNPSGHTAAHRTLAFGSRVTVTNPQNGSSVTVVINDRGPFTRGLHLICLMVRLVRLACTERSGCACSESAGAHAFTNKSLLGEMNQEDYVCGPIQFSIRPKDGGLCGSKRICLSQLRG